MKKQLLLMPLVGLLCFASCSKEVKHELTPVDDKTGLERIASILAKENAAIEDAQTNPTNIFKFLPHKIAFTEKSVVSSHTKLPEGGGIGNIPYLVETNINNLTVSDLLFEVNYDALQIHVYNTGNTGMKFVYETNFFYDQNKNYCYHLLNQNGMKVREEFKVESAEQATTIFGNLLSGDMYANLFETFIPASYLDAMVTLVGEEGNQTYQLLDDYGKVQEYFDLYGNDGDYINYQFGSNDENSFSLKTNLKTACRFIPRTATYPVILDGEFEGLDVASYTYNEDLSFLNKYCLYSDASYIPDLVVFKDNYLSFASATSKLDAKSLEQYKIPANALYEHMTAKTTLEVSKDKVDIINPNPEDYLLIENAK